MIRHPYPQKKNNHHDMPHPSVSHAHSLIADISTLISHQYGITTSRWAAENGRMESHLAKKICRLTGPCSCQKLDGMADLVKTLLQVQLVCRQLFGHGVVLGLSR